MSDRSVRRASELKRLAGEFINIQSNRASLITVTDTTLSSDMKEATVLLSVFPDTQEKAALDFLNRNRKEFGSFLIKESKIGRLPKISFVIDKGETNRKRIYELIKEDSK